MISHLEELLAQQLITAGLGDFVARFKAIDGRRFHWELQLPEAQAADRSPGRRLLSRPEWSHIRCGLPSRLREGAIDVLPIFSSTDYGIWVNRAFTFSTDSPHSSGQGSERIYANRNRVKSNWSLTFSRPTWGSVNGIEPCQRCEPVLVAKSITPS